MPTATRRETRTMDPHLARARKKAEFLATIRRPQTGVRLAPAATQVVDAEVTRRGVAPLTPTPTRAAAPAVAPTAATAAPVAAPPPPSVRLFREQALRHRMSSEEGRGVVRVSPPWTWALLSCVVVALGAGVVTSFVGSVEVTSRGRGVVRPSAGVRALTSQMAGTVTKVEVRSGERVKAGTPLVRVDSAAAQAELLEADRQLEAVRTQFSGVASQQDQHYGEQIESLKARVRRQVDQIASLRASASHQDRRLQADLSLLRKGLVSEMAVADTRESVAQAQRQLGGAELALDQMRQELASLESRRQDELWQRDQLVRAAQTKRDALALVLRQGVIEASEDGVVEALTVRPGESVQAGQVIGKIVPVDSPLHVVSLLAERDRTFAKPGDEVRLELDGLPHAEYGTMGARVVRIGGDLASPQEIREAFGEEQKLDGAAYRVELEITDDGAARAAGVKLRTGALMNVRYTLRKQRLAAMIFSPLRRWLR